MREIFRLLFNVTIRCKKVFSAYLSKRANFASVTIITRLTTALIGSGREVLVAQLFTGELRVKTAKCDRKGLQHGQRVRDVARELLVTHASELHRDILVQRPHRVGVDGARGQGGREGRHGAHGRVMCMVSARTRLPKRSLVVRADLLALLALHELEVFNTRLRHSPMKVEHVGL